jgi:uncharacterized damage-inducible protein DinB
MTTHDIRLLFAYNRWANARMLAAVARLSPDQLTRDLGNSFASVRDTLVHIYGAEWIWLERWKGTSPTAAVAASDFPDVATLAARWKTLEDEQSAFIKDLTDADLEQPIEYANLKGDRFINPLGPLMQHLVNHSTYHRGQITTLVRQLGAAPAGTDLVTFLRERGGR